MAIQGSIRLRRAMVAQQRAIIDQVMRQIRVAKPEQVVMDWKGGSPLTPGGGGDGNTDDGTIIFVLGYSKLGSDDVLG